jgi:hypothetical protein
MAMGFSRKIGLVLVCFSALKYAAAVELLPLPLSTAELTGIAFDGFKPHEIAPLGVPSGYDWAKAPRIGAGNKPNQFTAATGWGQAFYAKGAPATATSAFIVRNFQTLVCTASTAGIQWSLVQQGSIEGREFRADFAGNASAPARRFVTTGASSEVEFTYGSAFHFWPMAGRFSLPASDVCGFLIYLEAKQIAGPPQSVVMGLGADYWTTRTAPWDNYKTNRDIAIGRLKVLNGDWQRIGLTTALGDALKSLKEVGYVDATRDAARGN